VRELAEETGLRGRPGPLVGFAERVGEGYHYVILDFWVEVEADHDPVADDDAVGVVWASGADLDRLPLVDHLAEWLAEHGVLDHLS